MNAVTAPTHAIATPPHAASRVTLVLMSGMPGTGRHELAARLARAQGWALMSKDVVTRALAEVGVAEKLAAYTVMFGIAALNLRNGMSTVLDATFSLPRTRTQARTMAEEAGAVFTAVSCICSDTDIWQQRLETDPPMVEGWAPAAFVSPEHMRKRYYPFRGPHLQLDTVEPLDTCYERLVTWLAERH